ncbi:type II toxin-antitoxin system RatA family toxin [Streptomyces maoxianensis]|uniref:Type II toxin-antitoxin system RatA family toxin n=1 Tax=Streptomyces maoxianensis TaxID=1459942 RepID=A0ABV9G1Z7_9ACTN|nr:SRPBCC family protein [Streptomyces sp. ISL-1]MBT2389530.1 SRPBCC family protein [Streptomyces sp. ISL-1]
MAVLHTTHTSAGTADQLWQVLLDCEAFPSYMEGVNEVTITGEEEGRRSSSWVVELKGSEMEWDQEDVIDTERRRLEFRQTDGDLAQYEGYWQVVADGAGATLELNVEFDIGLPMVAEMIHPAVAKALEGYQQGIVAQSLPEGK